MLIGAIYMENRFKGLDLIDRVPDEIWNEVHDIVQETGIKTIPMGNKAAKGFPGGKESAHKCRRHRFDPWVAKVI